jgi:uncharacterized protein (DUF2252 family)
MGHGCTNGRVEALMSKKGKRQTAVLERPRPADGKGGRKGDEKRRKNGRKPETAGPGAAPHGKSAAPHGKSAATPGKSAARQGKGAALQGTGAAPQDKGAASQGTSATSPSTTAAADEASVRVEHVSYRQAVDRGLAARDRAPLSSHGVWAPGPDRRGAVDIVASQAASREPDLVPIRHGRMAVSPFTFFRGAAAVMAADLAATPVSGVRVQLCGDAHLLNFGGFASAERNFVFDINDFDETIPGPWEWDVKRLAASIEVAARDVGLATPDRRSCVVAAARNYREAMLAFAQQSELDVWYARMDETSLMDRVRTELDKATVSTVERNVAKARQKDNLKAFAKLTAVMDGTPRIVANPPLVVPMRDMLGEEQFAAREHELTDLFRAYRRTLQSDRRHLLEQYRMVDIARKVVGVGSVGTRCWVLLLSGRIDDDPLFLQAKEAQESVLAPFVGKSRVSNQGQRVVEGQRVMQAASDIFLGWVRATGFDGRSRDFYLRQLWDWKISIDVSNQTASTLGAYARVCGWVLARAHARSGDRIALAAYLGETSEFDEAIGDFAAAYADQNEQDFEAFSRAIEHNVVPCLMGV